MRDSKDAAKVGRLEKVCLSRECERLILLLEESERFLCQKFDLVPLVLASLQERNEALEAKVKDLRKGLSAIG